MARNKGKRPAGATAPTPPTQSPKADDGKAGAKPASAPAGASSAIAAKIDTPKTTTATSGGTQAGGKSPAPQSAASAPSTSAKAASAAGNAPDSRGDDRRPAASATAPTSGKRPESGGPTAGPPRGGSSGGGSSGTGSSNGGFWPGLLGGVIGGAATVLAASFFWAGGNDALTTLESSTSDLDGRLTAAEERVGQIDTLDERIAVIEAQPTVETSGGGTDLAARLAELETQLGDLAGAPAAAGDGDAAADERLAAIEERLESISSEVQAASDAQRSSADVLSTLQSTLPTLQGVVDGTSQAIEDAGERTAALGQSVETLQGTAEQLSGDVQSLSSRLGEAESQLDHIGGEYQRGAAMIVAIGDVDRAIARAEPYDSSLQSLQSLVRDDAVLGETLATLEPMAADGVPTVADLKGSFGETASRVLLAADGDQSLADQVEDNLFGIINMRPSGAEAEGNDERAVVARAQARLTEDDLSGAVAELSGLEGAAAEAAAPWVLRAEQRLAAEAAVQDLRSHAQGLVAKGS